MRTLLQPVRTSHKDPRGVGSHGLKKLANLWSVLQRIPFGPLAAKLVVVVFFTACWLLIALVRSDGPLDPAAMEGSSLMALAASLQQGEISGRDFQSVYGPAAQMAAWGATRLTRTGSALDAYGMILFVFCAATIGLVAVVLLLCNRVSWQQAAVFYVFSFALNLFHDPLDIRTALLLLNVVVAYRVVASETMLQQTLWASAAGIVCFLSQLVTFESGLLSAVAVVCAVATGMALTRNAAVLFGVHVFVATLAAANLALAAAFKLTAAHPILFFDYHSFAFEILRGYHNTMGVLWGLSLVQTLVLLGATGYVVGVCAAAAWKSDSLDASFLASLTFGAIVWLKMASVRSDVPQIVVAFTPVAVVVSLLAMRNWGTLKARAGWAVAAASLVLAWPTLTYSAATDLWSVVRGDASPRAALKRLYGLRRPLDENIQASLVTPDLADRRNVPLLAFPYDNYVAIGTRRPVVAPVLETYAASTQSLEQYYVQALHRKMRSNPEVVYGLDRTDVPASGGVQAITRSPFVFEYLYRHFELIGNEEHADGHYILRPLYQPRTATVEPLNFSLPQLSLDSGIVKLSEPSRCGLIRLELNMEYTKPAWIFRPSGIEVSLSNSDQLVWRGTVRPLEHNQSFLTYISPLPPADFHKVFGHDVLPGTPWDKLEYHKLPADMLGAASSRIDVTSLHCLDPRKFAEPPPPPAPAPPAS